jgi:hypothetical protein
VTDLTPAQQAEITAYLHAFIAAAPDATIETIIAAARHELVAGQPMGESLCTH